MARCARTVPPARAVGPGALSCVPGMLDDSWVKVPVQPGGGEGLAKRKGGLVRERLKEAWSKQRLDEQEPDMRRCGPDE